MPSAASLRFAVAALLAAVAWASAPAAAEPRVVGWIEDVRLRPGDFAVPAKLDTGADLSSLHAIELKRVQRQGREWVAFTVVVAGSRIDFERPLVRVIRIKRRTEQDIRPVVSLGLCLAGVYAETEVTLVDRSGFDYPMLVGRAFLEGRFAVDPARLRTAAPDCPVGPPADLPS